MFYVRVIKRCKAALSSPIGFIIITYYLNKKLQYLDFFLRIVLESFFCTGLCSFFNTILHLWLEIRRTYAGGKIKHLH